MRFTVGYCLYPHGENNSIETRMRLIFDDGLPATELNRHLVMAQLNRDKPLGTTVYQLCIYLNFVRGIILSMLLVIPPKLPPTTSGT